jgi:hypothetical protein
MSKFDADTLRALRDVQEPTIRTDKHPKSAVVIWVVVDGDDVFVRSWLGTKGRWYKDLATGGPATLEFAGAGWRCTRSQRVTVPRLTGPAAKSCGNIGAAVMRRRWCVPKSCRRRCGLNRVEPPPRWRRH